MSKILANRVKEICADKGIQLKELAAIMDVKPESLSRTLNGNPQLSSLENIAKALNVGEPICSQIRPKTVSYRLRLPPIPYIQL